MDIESLNELERNFTTIKLIYINCYSLKKIPHKSLLIED